jgi:F420-non-reducing hydrogenase iron-sulfur subunit
LVGDCHYLEGNVRAEKRVAHVKELLKSIGLGAERLEMHFISSAMGREFAELTTGMTERMRELGPSPLREREASP